MIHYIYKIHFLCGYPSGRYYIGKRSYRGNDLSKDKYTGSGNFCKAYFRKYGTSEGKTYIKEILEINPSKKINSDREVIAIGDLWKTDPLCMNLVPGGCYGNIAQDIAIIQYDKEGNFIAKYDSIEDACNKIGWQLDCTIRACCNRKRKSTAGYQWRFYNDPLDIKDTKKDKYWGDRKVVQLDDDNNIIATYKSLADAGKSVGAPWQAIQRVCNGKRIHAKGYKWKYV